jgi:hypothetical protein
MHLSQGAVLRQAVVLSASWAVHKEANGLALCDVIESYQADVRVGEGALAGINLCEHLVWVGAAEHWQLPHCPVAVVIVALQTGVCVTSRIFTRGIQSGDLESAPQQHTDGHELHDMQDTVAIEAGAYA